jgi:tight adherence protein C
MDIDQNVIAIVVAFLACLSLVGFIIPFVNRAKKKDRYKSLIQDRRKNLYQEAVDASKTKEIKRVNTQEDLATFYKVEKLIGKTSADIRKKLANAGYRSPNAPIKYMIFKIILPVIGGLFAYIYLSPNEEMKDFNRLIIIFGAAVFGFYCPEILIKNKIQKRQQEINISFPDALDMILVCVQGGISIEQAIARISDEIAMQSQILAEELALLSAEMGLLSDRRQAYTDFAERVGGGSARAFGTAMVQSEKYGTSVSQAIRVMADELRDTRMQLAEQKAASLPPKLTVPMILFFLPPLFIAILGPAFIQVEDSGVR